MSITVSSIHRYPVKSCRGEAIESAIVEPWGLAGDRRWMLVDNAGTTITAREVNRMVLVHPELTPTGLRVTAPGAAPLDVDVPDVTRQVPVALWSSRLTAACASADVDAWFSDVLGISARLVWLDDPTRRPTSPAFSQPEDRVNFADGYPLLVTSEESLSALNDVVPMTRFRPNVVVSGAEAWAEDDWRRIRIGDATFRAVKGSARCVMTTIDPRTGEREKEPIATLARLRRWDSKVWFGVNLIPDTPGAVLRVGDKVDVLEAVAPGTGPARSTTGNPVAQAH